MLLPRHLAWVLPAVLTGTPDIPPPVKRMRQTQELMAAEEFKDLGGDLETVGMTAKLVLKRMSVKLTEKPQGGKPRRDIMVLTLEESGLLFKQRPVAEAIWVNL